jgi:hypothetical protein
MKTTRLFAALAAITVSAFAADDVSLTQAQLAQLTSLRAQVVYYKNVRLCSFFVAVGPQSDAARVLSEVTTTDFDLVLWEIDRRILLLQRRLAP